LKKDDITAMIQDGRRNLAIKPNGARAPSGPAARWEGAVLV